MWQEIEPLVQRTNGLLVIDDTTLDKPYAQKMALVSRHWSGKHHAVVEGYQPYDAALDGRPEQPALRLPLV